MALAHLSPPAPTDACTPPPRSPRPGSGPAEYRRLLELEAKDELKPWEKLKLHNWRDALIRGGENAAAVQKHPHAVACDQCLGTFDTEEHAARARDMARVWMGVHDEFDHYQYAEGRHAWRRTNWSLNFPYAQYQDVVPSLLKIPTFDELQFKLQSIGEKQHNDVLCATSEAALTATNSPTDQDETARGKKRAAEASEAQAAKKKKRKKLMNQTTRRRNTSGF